MTNDINLKEIEKFKTVQAYVNRNVSVVIGNNLKRIRAEHGYSILKIAKMTGIVYQTLLRIEEGTSANMTMDYCRKLADVYGLSLEAFITEILKGVSTVEVFPEKDYFIADLSDIYPYNLIKALDLDIDLRMIDPYLVQDALNDLTEKEKLILDQRYRQGKTLASIGEYLGITRERVRQIENRSFRKIRKPSVFRKMLRIDREELEKLKEENSQLKKDINHLSRSLKKYEEPEEMFISDINSNYYISLEDLNLSVRSFNCLSKKGLMTAGEIAALSTDEILRIRNLGRRSILEVQRTLDELGVKRNFNIPA